MIYLTATVLFLLAVLSGLGVGGGGLLIIYLALFTDTPQLAAQGINLLFFLFSSGASILVHLGKRKIFTSAVVLMALFGVAGALVGSYFSTVIAENLLRKLFGAMLAVCGTASLCSSKIKNSARGTKKFSKNRKNLRKTIYK